MLDLSLNMSAVRVCILTIYIPIRSGRCELAVAQVSYYTLMPPFMLDKPVAYGPFNSLRYGSVLTHYSLLET